MASQPITWDGKDAQGKAFAWDARGLTWDGSVPGRNTKMTHVKVNLGFASGSDQAVEATTNAVLENLYGNAAYATPPVTKVALQTALTELMTAIGDQEQGGTAATAVKNEKRDTLVELLRQLASYVELNCNNNLATLLSSGFQAASTNRTQQPLEKPIMKLLPGDKTMLIGLANDELGYIIPKRQWDHDTPFAYGRKSGQYGEENSCGPLTAGVLMGALEHRVADVQKKSGK